MVQPVILFIITLSHKFQKNFELKLFLSLLSISREPKTQKSEHAIINSVFVFFFSEIII